MPSRSFTATVVRDGPSCYVLLPFDPKAVFGTLRAPVVVTIGGYTLRTRVVAMGGPICVGLRREHREAAGLEGGETVAVEVALDTTPRTVTAPADLLRALKPVAGGLVAWKALSYTHQREHVEAIEGAKQPATRERRIAAAVAMVTAKAATTARPAKAAKARGAAAQTSAGSPSTSRSGGTHAARARTSRTRSKL